MQLTAIGVPPSSRRDGRNQILLAMKCTLILLLAACLQVSARGYSQTISVKLKDVSFEKALKEIAKKSGYRFFYLQDQIKNAKPVSIEKENTDVKDVLSELFKQQPLKYEIINKTIVVSQKDEKRYSVYVAEDLSPELISTPTIDVTGRVTDSTGGPLQGAIIRVRSTNQGTTSDANGYFTLKSVDEKAMIEISYLGFEIRTVKAQENIGSVSLKMKSKELDVVTVEVNTGYQKIPKERVTGSFTHINKELFNEQVGTGVIERLKYISNGVTNISNRTVPSLSNQLLIRGISTLTLSIQRPLVILDNFEYQGDLENINPNDVENITFLKDAAAASIWGVKAANGVIVITTKKATSNQPLRIEFNSNVTVVQEPDLFSLPLMSSSDQIDLETFLFDRGYYNSRIAAPKFNSLSPVVSILNRRRLGQLTADQAQQQINVLRGQDVRNSFQQLFYQPTVNQQYSLSLSGGSANNSWLLSAGYDHNVDQLANLQKRFTVRADHQYQFNRRLDFSTSIYLVQNLQVSGKPAWGNIRTRTGSLPQYISFSDQDGRPIPFYNDSYDQSYIDTAGAGLLLNWQYFPSEDYKHNQTTINTLNINTQTGFTYKPFSFLSVDVKYRYQLQRGETQLLQTQNSYYTRNLINSFAQINYQSRSVSFPIPVGDILDLTNSNLAAHNLRTQVNANKKWNNQSIVALLGGELGTTVASNNSFRTYGYNPETFNRVNVDFANTYPHFVTGNRNFIPNSSSFGKTTQNIVSLFSNAAYTLSNKYSFSASARRDASNMFGLNTNDKWNPLWSVGASWLVSSENFYKLQWLSSLKLRVTYGRQGNLDPTKSAVTTVNYIGSNPFTLTPYGQVVNFYNPELRWEQSRMLNVGVDFRFKNDRIYGSIEFFRKQLNDLYGQVLIDPSAGIGRNITKNVGNMEGHGMDVQINTQNTDGKFKWYSTFIFNFYKDRVTKNAPLPLTGSQFAGGGFNAREGYSPFAYFALRWAGLDPANGDPQGIINGQISKNYNALVNEVASADLIYKGSLLPILFGSVGNNFKYKGFSLAVRITYKLGYYFRRESIQYGSMVSQLIGHADYSRRWQKAGDEESTEIPSFIYPVNNLRDQFYLLSDVLATRGDHVRMQYINLSYQLPGRHLKKLGISQLQVYTVVNNLGIPWRANKQGLDPDFNGIPPQRSIAAGLRLTF